MPDDEKSYIPDHFLLFANEHFSVSVHHFMRTQETDGWYFFDGKRGNIGTLIVMREDAAHWNVHGSFTVKVNREHLWPYLVDLVSIGVHAAFVSVHTGGKDTIWSNFEE